MCCIRAWPSLLAQWYSLQGGLARPQQRHHQLRQFFVCHAHCVPVHHHGGLDRRSLLGNVPLCIRNTLMKPRWGHIFLVYLSMCVIFDLQERAKPSPFLFGNKKYFKTKMKSQVHFKNISFSLARIIKRV